MRLPQLKKLEIYTDDEARPVLDHLYITIYLDREGSYISWFFRKTSYTLTFGMRKEVEK